MTTDLFLAVDNGNQEKAPPSPRWWLFRLYFRPRSFFQNFAAFATPFAVAYVSLFMGVADVSDRFSRRITQYELGGKLSVPEIMTHSWLGYWIACVLFGILDGAVYYMIGGWWYRVRLNWSGEAAADPARARNAYVFATLVWALPVVLLSIGDSLRYSTPLAAEQRTNDLWFLGVIMIFWSIVVSYRGVRVLFQVQRWKARIWFLVLPASFYAALVVAASVLGALVASGAIPIEPKLDRTNRLDRPSFSLEYPGNWSIDEHDEDYDPDYDFSIEPLQDAVVIFHLTDELLDLDEATASSSESHQKVFKGGKPAAFQQWGRLSGVGAEFFGNYEGRRCKIRIFSVNGAARGLLITEIVAESDVPVLEPGFALIRKTFRFQDQSGK